MDVGVRPSRASREAINSAILPLILAARETERHTRDEIDNMKDIQRDRHANDNFAPDARGYEEAAKRKVEASPSKTVETFMIVNISGVYIQGYGFATVSPLPYYVYGTGTRSFGVPANLHPAFGQGGSGVAATYKSNEFEEAA